jgi:hypothetical protein
VDQLSFDEKVGQITPFLRRRNVVNARNSSGSEEPVTRTPSITGCHILASVVSVPLKC